MRLHSKVLISLVFAILPGTWASSIDYIFDTPTGNLGTQHTYLDNFDGIPITAYGFNSHGTDDLYGSATWDENGLGLTGNPDYAITTTSYVQLNLSNLWVLEPTSVSIEIGSVQCGDSWDVYGSNTLGVLGTPLLPTQTIYMSPVNLPSSADNYEYISVEARSGDVLLNSLDASFRECSTVPEPGTSVLMGAGLLGVAVLLGKARKGHKP